MAFFCPILFILFLWVIYPLTNWHSGVCYNLFWIPDWMLLFFVTIDCWSFGLFGCCVGLIPRYFLVIFLYLLFVGRFLLSCVIFVWLDCVICLEYVSVIWLVPLLVLIDFFLKYSVIGFWARRSVEAVFKIFAWEYL